MENARLVVVGAAGLALCASRAVADYKDQIGFTLLKTELGQSAPTGAGVNVVHAESGVASIDANPVTGEFAGKHFDFLPAAPAAVDGHAQIVGSLFYGNSSIAPGIHNISHFVGSFASSGAQQYAIPMLPPNYASNPIDGDCNADGTVDAVDFNTFSLHFNQLTTKGPTDGDFNRDGKVDSLDFGLMGANFGKSGLVPTLTQPAVSLGRVSNHSYLQWSDITTRVDWMAATDDTIFVAAVNNNESTPPASGDSGYFPACFNTISVGRLDGLHTIVNASTMAPYVAGRQAPLLVAPESKTSFATPVVSAVAALLVQTGHSQPALSVGSYLSPRTGQRIYNAETLEVIKAALLAGADRSAISTYAVNTAAGMDSRYGAGDVNAYNSYHIQAGGENNSRERGNTRNVTRWGFDYEPAMTSTSTATYSFTADLARTGVIASLAWNAKIDGGTVPYWNGAATLYHFNLGLYDQANPATAVAMSNSSIESTQNLFFPSLVRGHSYVLKVTAASGQAPFTWDYGLAWRFMADASIVSSSANGVYQLVNGDTNGDGRVDSVDSDVLGTNWGRTDARWDDGDFNGDGTINGTDFSLLSANFGYVRQSTAQPEMSAAALVPEPTIAGLAMATTLLLGRRRRRS